jgi:hypothetical protein
MSPAAIAEFLELWAATEDIQLNDREDKLVWRWTGDGEYTAKSVYKMLHGGSISFRGHSLIWKTWAPLKVKIFLWLAFWKRHWTARHAMAWKLRRTATYATKHQRRSITCSVSARLPGKCGSTFSMPSACSYRLQRTR